MNEPIIGPPPPPPDDNESGTVINSGHYNFVFIVSVLNEIYQ